MTLSPSGNPSGAFCQSQGASKRRPIRSDDPHSTRPASAQHEVNAFYLFDSSVAPGAETYWESPLVGPCKQGIGPEWVSPDIYPHNVGTTCGQATDCLSCAVRPGESAVQRRSTAGVRLVNVRMRLSMLILTLLRPQAVRLLGSSVPLCRMRVHLLRLCPMGNQEVADFVAGHRGRPILLQRCGKVVISTPDCYVGAPGQ